ncbi:hypothetical protein AB0F25_30415 [Streptomyces wedmorensis]|uniref:hypothetical protein n=1 Tax=Streptomyces wedmorensis TaxID=43759 RepID=UPI0034257EEF
MTTPDPKIQLALMMNAVAKVSNTGRDITASLNSHGRAPELLWVRLDVELQAVNSSHKELEEVLDNLPTYQKCELVDECVNPATHKGMIQWDEVVKVCTPHASFPAPHRFIGDLTWGIDEKSPVGEKLMNQDEYGEAAYLEVPEDEQHNWGFLPYCQHCGTDMMDPCSPGMSYPSFDEEKDPECKAGHKDHRPVYIWVPYHDRYTDCTCNRELIKSQSLHAINCPVWTNHHHLV